ncbi:MAG: hypothetical protein JSW73_01310 [Candidatus Woesearchaeota archaeon]|nr:MAG: hypothetical protein JSW73_01310 [Candidatus Woesearchaeota archaeon]
MMQTDREKDRPFVEFGVKKLEELEALAGEQVESGLIGEKDGKLQLLFAGDERDILDFYNILALARKIPPKCYFLYTRGSYLNLSVYQKDMEVYKYASQKLKNLEKRMQDAGELGSGQFDSPIVLIGQIGKDEDTLGVIWEGRVGKVQPQIQIRRAIHY